MLESEISLRDKEEIDAQTSTIAISEFFMKSLESGEKLDQFERNLGLGIVFHPNLSFYSFRFHFQIII